MIGQIVNDAPLLGVRKYNVGKKVVGYLRYETVI